jgi:hypothetical protein
MYKGRAVHGPCTATESGLLLPLPYSPPLGAHQLVDVQLHPPRLYFSGAAGGIIYFVTGLLHLYSCYSLSGVLLYRTRRPCMKQQTYRELGEVLERLYKT